jgi:pSer/pThr/pTyr-binding forkhead associated (FHA) protein
MLRSGLRRRGSTIAVEAQKTAHAPWGMTAMQVKLRIVGGKNAGQEVAVTVPRLAIGRGTQCQLRPKSDAVAEHHCDLLVEPGRVQIIDQGSRFGTLVNGQRISGSQELKAGDRLTIGPLEFELVVVASVAGKKKPKVTNVEEAAARLASAGRDQLDDISQWVGSGDDDAPVVSRYATQLTAEEIAALGSGGPAKSSHKPVSAAGDVTTNAAADALNRLLKRP